MRPTLVILVVGLSPALIGEHTPNLRKLARDGALRPLNTVTPAVTCTAQSTLVTGLMPSGTAPSPMAGTFAISRRSGSGGNPTD